jgi:hypothetical protein
MNHTLPISHSANYTMNHIMLHMDTSKASIHIFFIWLILLSYNEPHSEPYSADITQ